MGINKRDSGLFLESLLRIALPITMPVLLLGIMMALISSRYLKQEIDSAEYARLQNYAYFVDSELSEIDALDIGLASNPAVRIELKRIFESLEDGISYEEYEFLDTVSSLLYSSVNANGMIDSAYIYYENPGGWFLTSKARLSSLAGSDDTTWYDIWKERKDETSFTKERVESWRSRNEVFSIFRTLSDGDGVIVLNLLPSRMNEILSSLTYGTDGFLMILSDEKRVLLRSSMIPLPSYMIASGSDYISVGDDSYRVYHHKTSLNGWDYVLLYPIAAIYRQIHLLWMVAFLLTLFAIAVAFSIAILRARNDSKRLMLLRKELPMMAEGKTFSEKGDVYSRMIDSVISSYLEIQRLENALEKGRLKERELELQTLSMQLTPHFLFNTLQSVNFKAMEISSGPNDASLMIESLSKLLRYVLDDVNPFAPLSEEIEAAKSYASIQRMRYGSRYNVSFIISDADDSAAFPKLILQPLIENAFTHGLRPKGGGDIKVVIYTHLGIRLKVRIIDNGVGMDKQRLREVRKGISGGSIGLGNTARRLSILYPADNNFGIVSSKGKGTCITFSIPL